jgi:hypothetical protein
MSASGSAVTPISMDPAEWVDWKMNEFMEFVGFSIVGCETQCKALFQRIERSRHPRGGS